MDLLTDVLQQARMKRRLLALRHLPVADSFRFPCDKSIGFHVVTRGRLFIHADSLTAPLELHAGDAALMARGCTHVVSTEAAPPFDPRETGGPTSPAEGDGAPATPAANALVSGAYQLWIPPVHPFFKELPDWFVLRAQSVPRLSALSLAMALVAQEEAQPDLGSETILNGLLDVAFAYLLREIVAQTGAVATGWSQAVRDPRIRLAVELMHEDTAHDWTLDELARRAGLSRTAFAQRFRESMGDTPLNHLRTLRMQKAMRILTETENTLDDVASAVGYQDAFGFSKVFKKTVGLAPREFRRQDAAGRSTPWRL